MVTLLPWNDASVVKSPYVAVLDRIGLPAAGVVMDVIVLTSVLSCLNSALYTASRMAYSLAVRGDAPKAFGRLSSAKVPVVAVLASTVVGFVTVFFNYVSPDTVFLFLTNSSGAVAVFVWLVIAISQLRMRRVLERETPHKLTLRMWGYPYLTWVSIAGMIALLLGMLFDDGNRTQLAVSVVVAVIVVGVGVWRQRTGRHVAVAKAPAPDAAVAD